MDFASQTQAQAPRRPFLTAPSFHRGGTTAQNFQRLIFGIFFRASPPGVHPGLEGVMSGTMAPTFQQLIHRPWSGRRRRPSPSEGSSHTSLPTRMPRGLAEHRPYDGSRRTLILQSTTAQVPAHCKFNLQRCCTNVLIPSPRALLLEPLPLLLPLE